MKLKKFFDEEMRLFSIYDCERSLPDAIDGFKPSQRKVIFGMLKRGENATELRVETAANHVAAVSDYHHGAAGLIGTIAKMAQTFAGSNNINLLMPNGQFGSRLDPTPGAGRYILTEMSKNFRMLFKKEDDTILKHLKSDGIEIEPERYFPIMPMLLVNGASGTGTGYACNIFSYNPEDIKNNILAILNGKKPKEIFPWYRGYKGKVTRNDKQTVIEGMYELISSTVIRFTELPIGMYQDDFKEHLNDLKDAEIIKSYSDSSTETSFDFEVTIPRTTGQMSHETIMKTFKLIGRDTENFTCWGHDGKMKVFDTAQDIINYFVEFRLQKYEERRLKQIGNFTEELRWSNEKLRFIKFYLKNPNEFAKKNKSDLYDLLVKNKFADVDRLLQIRIYSLTKDEIEKLEKEIEDLTNTIKVLKATSNLELYIKELKELNFK